MFTIIFEKKTGEIINITSESDADNLRNAIPEEYDFIFVEELPFVKPYRQKMMVVSKKLKVVNVELTPEQEKEVERTEIYIEMDEKQTYLKETDYISSKLAEASAKYIATNDNKEVIALRDKYKIELQTREQYRQRISELKDILEGK